MNTDTLIEPRVEAWRAKLRRISGERVKSRILALPSEDALYPLMLFRGNNSLGRYQSLWKFLLACQECGAETATDLTHLSDKSLDLGHLCGLHAPLARSSIRGFLSRLWAKPEVMQLEPSLRDYVGSVFEDTHNFFPVDLIEIPRWARRSAHYWRIQRRYARSAEPVPSVWPFIEGDATDEHQLIMTVDGVVPKGLPEDVRQDVCQDLLLGIIAGEITLEGLKGSVPEYVARVFKQAPSKYRVVSLDRPPPWAGDDERTLAELLAEGTGWKFRG